VEVSAPVQDIEQAVPVKSKGRIEIMSKEQLPNAACVM
jgi:hypothetical protein